MQTIFMEVPAPLDTAEFNQLAAFHADATNGNEVGFILSQTGTKAIVKISTNFPVDYSIPLPLRPYIIAEAVAKELIASPTYAPPQQQY